MSSDNKVRTEEVHGVDMMTQGEAVFQAVSQVFSVESAVPETKLWSSEQKATIYALVFNSFQSGNTMHRDNPTPEALMKYIPGLVNNWVRKDKRLNGNTTYVPKNPGSRAGSGDVQLSTMKQLLRTVSEPADRAQIQEAINKRQAELKPEVKIDASKLPEHLRHLVAVSR